MVLFDSEFLQRLEYLSLVSRRAFRGELFAQRRSRQRGTGIEFADHRQYAVGDDLRYVDWHAYARLGDVLLKRFQEEADLRVHLLIDCSKSMGTAAPDDTAAAQPHSTKFDVARQVAAALAYIALADLDRVSVTAFSREMRYLSPDTGEGPDPRASSLPAGPFADARTYRFGTVRPAMVPVAIPRRTGRPAE